MNQMDFTPSASSCTLHWSLSALRVAFCACHGFDPGGARLPAEGRDVMHSHQFILHPFDPRMLGATTEDDPPHGVVQCRSFDLSPIRPPKADRRKRGTMWDSLLVSETMERAYPVVQPPTK